MLRLSPKGNDDAINTELLDKNVKALCIECGERWDKISSSDRRNSTYLRRPKTFREYCAICTMFSTSPNSMLYLMYEAATRFSNMSYFAIQGGSKGFHYYRHVYFFPLRHSQHRACEKATESGQITSATTVDLDRVKQWMLDCDTFHTSLLIRCKSLSIDGPTKMKLRIIDCQTQRVQLLERHEPYICLSYVWGGCTASKETSRLGSELPVHIRKTIEHAIHM
jgi:hypothetical protein